MSPRFSLLLIFVCGSPFPERLLASTSPDAPDPLVAYVTPSAVHLRLERYSGMWDAELRLFPGSGGPTQTFALKAESGMILDGRFLQTRLFGLMQGMLFEELATLGFDNASQRFTRNAIHTFGTGSLVTSGTWLEPDRVIELHGESIHPSTGATIRVRQRLTFESSDAIVFETFEQLANSPESKTLEHRLTRTP